MYFTWCCWVFVIHVVIKHMRFYDLRSNRTSTVLSLPLSSVLSVGLKLFIIPSQARSSWHNVKVSSPSLFMALSLPPAQQNLSKYLPSDVAGFLPQSIADPWPLCVPDLDIHWLFCSCPHVSEGFSRDILSYLDCGGVGSGNSPVSDPLSCWSWIFCFLYAVKLEVVVKFQTCCRMVNACLAFFTLALMSSSVPHDWWSCCLCTQTHWHVLLPLLRLC